MTFKEFYSLTESTSDDSTNDLLAMADTIERPMYFVKIDYEYNGRYISIDINPVFITDENRIKHIIQHVLKNDGFYENMPPDYVAGVWSSDETEDETEAMFFEIFSYSMPAILKFVYDTTKDNLGEESAKNLIKHIKKTRHREPEYDYDWFILNYIIDETED